jgi:hypothetical protein
MIIIVTMNVMFFVWLLNRNLNEHFDILDYLPETIIKQEENRQCPLVSNKQHIPSMVNYELLEHPTHPNVCYIRYENKEINRASCSRANNDIYHNDLGNTVSFQIGQIYDPYKSVLMEKDVCLVEFAGDDIATKQINATTYAKFLSDNDSRVKTSTRDIQSTTKSIEQKQSNIDHTKNATKNIYDVEIPSVNTQIQNVHGEIKHTYDHVGSKNGVLHQTRDEWAKLQKNPHILKQGFSITNGNILVNPISGDKLEMLGDGRLRLSNKDNQTTWQSYNTIRGLGPHRLILTDKGHMYIVNKYNTIVWIPGRIFRHTDRSPFTLIVQADGNLVLYDGNKRPLWATNTWRR